MKTIIPASQNSETTRFQLETDNSYYDVIIDHPTKFMRAFEMTYSDESGDWEEREISPANVSHELEGYVFAGLADKPVTFRQMEAMFTSMLFMSK